MYSPSISRCRIIKAAACKSGGRFVIIVPERGGGNCAGNEASNKRQRFHISVQAAGVYPSALSGPSPGGHQRNRRGVQDRDAGACSDSGTI